MPVKTAENYIITIMLIIFVLTIGYFCSRLAGNLYFNMQLEKLAPPTESQTPDYGAQINSINDPYKLAQMGMGFLRTNNDEFGLQALQKTTALDPKWRDGWLWLGYAQIKLGQSKIALETLKKAESLDPIYPLTYKLLAIAYEQVGDESSANKAKDKEAYLEKER